jgi:hypothetical protein
VGGIDPGRPDRDLKGFHGIGILDEVPQKNRFRHESATIAMASRWSCTNCGGASGIGNSANSNGTV